MDKITDIIGHPTMKGNDIYILSKLFADKKNDNYISGTFTDCKFFLFCHLESATTKLTQIQDKVQ